MSEITFGLRATNHDECQKQPKQHKIPGQRDSTGILTKCLWRHLRLLRYLRQNSHRYRMGSEVSSCGYGEKYHGFNRWRPNSIHSMFFMRVTMSSWLRSDTRLPVMRGADGMPSELSWESWWDMAKTLDSILDTILFNTAWFGQKHKQNGTETLWCKWFKSSTLLQLGPEVKFSSFLIGPSKAQLTLWTAKHNQWAITGSKTDLWWW